MTKDLIKKYWNERNPSHDIDADTGEDRFFGTVRAVFEDVINHAKRRPFLFTVISHFKDDTFIDTELFYLEVGEEPKDFLQRAYKYIRNLHGESCIISKQEIRL